MSVLEKIHLKGQFGDCEGKNERDLLKISEIKNLLIVQIAQYKSSKISMDNITIDGLNFINKSLSVSNNNSTRILWSGPNNWLAVSTKVELIKEIKKNSMKKILLLLTCLIQKQLLKLKVIKLKKF